MVNHTCPPNGSTPARFSASAEPFPPNSAAVGEPLLVDIHGAAHLLAVSECTISRLDKQGLIPAPRYLLRARRWSIDELRAWLNAGSPCREEWEQMKRPGDQSKVASAGMTHDVRPGAPSAASVGDDI
jgi:hypothetical protein